jgi:hypothetical protein
MKATTFQCGDRATAFDWLIFSTTKVGQSVFWTEAITTVGARFFPFLRLLLARETYNHVWTWKGRKS